MSRTHELKTEKEVFEATLAGVKLFEFRKNDRGYDSGHMLALNEWDAAKQHYTGRAVLVYVTYVLYRGYGIPEGYCIMSLDPKFKYHINGKDVKDHASCTD